MPLTTEKTTFTRDVQGRYLCNDLTEVNSWKNSGGRPFDVIVIGGGTFGAAIAEHIWFRQKQTGGGLRTLVIEAGLFTIPEHVQNTGIQGLTDPFTPFNLNENAPQPSLRAMKCGASRGSLRFRSKVLPTPWAGALFTGADGRRDCSMPK